MRVNWVALNSFFSLISCPGSVFFHYEFLSCLANANSSKQGELSLPQYYVSGIWINLARFQAHLMSDPWFKMLLHLVQRGGPTKAPLKTCFVPTGIWFPSPHSLQPNWRWARIHRVSIYYLFSGEADEGHVNKCLRNLSNSKNLRNLRLSFANCSRISNLNRVFGSLPVGNLF